MKRKLLLTLFFAIKAVSCAIGLAACVFGGVGGHTHAMSYHPAVAATCTEDGTVEYWSCSGCGKNFANEDGSQELRSVVVPATGHDWDEW